MTTPPAYEKHTTSTDALDTLGSIIGPHEKRDAIHLAVEPAIAGAALAPGNHVILDVATNTAYPASIGAGIGIVDPFLEQLVEPGQRFWLVVYPRQISSLRHVWEHPAFAPSGETDDRNVAVGGIAPPPEVIAHYATTPTTETDQQRAALRDEAEAWLREYLEREAGVTDEDYGDPSYHTTFDAVIEEALSLGPGDCLHIGGSDAHGVVDPMFWTYLSYYTGEAITPPGEVYFSCSC